MAVLSKILLFIFFPTFGQSFLWLDGSCNYSFTLLFELLFIYMIIIINKNKYVLYIIISLFAGMCNENSSLSLIVFLILYIIYDRSNLKLKIISLISLISGYIFLFIAPGNYIRMNKVGGTTSFTNNIIEKLLFLITTFWPILLGVLILIIVMYKKHKKESIPYVIIYISSLVAFFSISVVSQLSIRSFTLSIIDIFIIIMYLVFNTKKESINKYIIICISLVFIFYYYNTMNDFIKYSRFINNRERQIIKAKNNKKEKVTLNKYENDNCRLPIGCELNDISDNYDEFPNNYMSNYYEIKIYGKNDKKNK